MSKDLFGDEIIKKLSIKDRFIIPPFSILEGNKKMQKYIKTFWCLKSRNKDKKGRKNT